MLNNSKIGKISSASSSDMGFNLKVRLSIHINLDMPDLALPGTSLIISCLFKKYRWLAHPQA